MELDEEKIKEGLRNSIWPACDPAKIDSISRAIIARHNSKEDFTQGDKIMVVRAIKEILAVLPSDVTIELIKSINNTYKK